VSKTRIELYQGALKRLGKLVSGETLDPVSAQAVDDLIDPMIANLNARGVIYIGDADEIPDEAFNPLRLRLAWEAAGDASGGRLINTIVEQLSDTAGSKYVYWRAPGTKAFGTTVGTPFRGQLVVGSTLYTVVGTKVYTSTSAGGAATALGGTLPGTTGVFMAANNAATPDIVIVAPGDGAFIITGGAVASLSGRRRGQPNSVVFHKGYFVFTYGDGKTRTSGHQLDQRQHARRGDGRKQAGHALPADPAG
jgi:hypothetical protein